ncbi:hypothetical protein [Brevundimonas sp. DC300-4]|uniref:hypothetical protein n=1 Tax=unclassified Brevundimonas TaxID=2622653 RepID=UPI003CE9F8F1
MVVFALISLAVSSAAVTGQSAPVAYTAQVYQAPVVRPFEPPSNFGRVTEEGDGGGDTRLRVITAPVSVEAYRRSYEHAPSRADNAYDAGVNNAERSMDARMGPLDGRWLLKDGEGRTLMTVSLMDQGETRPLEGGYRTADATAEVGPLTTAERSAGVLVLEMGGGRLSLQSAGEGWSGVLARGDREWPVTLVR